MVFELRAKILCTLKLELVRTSKILILTYQIALSQNAENQNTYELVLLTSIIE
jgi:hypothetical protein